jgi:hypothetical protein
MNKETFEVIMNYTKLVSELHSTVSDKIGTAVADLLVEPFDEYHAKALKLGKFQDDSQVIDKQGYITEEYERLSSYAKVAIIYSYDNGYSLCETTDGDLHLIPSKIISPEIKE